VPFWPGGLEEVIPDLTDLASNKRIKGMRTVAPGLSRGLRLPGEEPEEPLLDELEELDEEARDQDGDVNDTVCWTFVVFSYHFGLTIIRSDHCIYQMEKLTER
jgi:hypothetical protein